MKFLKRVLPCFVALMVTFSMFLCFAVPVNAADDAITEADFVGIWTVKVSSLSDPVSLFSSFEPLSGLSLSGSFSWHDAFNFSSLTVFFNTDFYRWSVGGPSSQYVIGCSSSSVAAPSYPLYIHSVNSSDHLISFYSFLITYFDFEPIPVYTIQIYSGTTSLLDHTSPSAPVSLTVTDNGGVFTFDDGSSQIFTYSGDVEFPGFAKSKYGPACYLPGNTYDLTGVSSLELYTGEWDPFPPLHVWMGQLDLSPALDELLALLPVCLPVAVVYIALRKGISFVFSALHTA